MTFTDLYAPCMLCNRKCADVLNRNSMNVDGRHVPRGFYSLQEPTDGPRLPMFLAANPGGGRGRFLEEQGFYDIDDPAALVARQRRFIAAQFATPKRGFHRKLGLMARCVLGLGPNDDVDHHAVFTELVKCTTPNDAWPSKEAIRNCVVRHLKREVRAWRPTVIIALGLRVYEWTASRHGRRIFGDTPVLRLPHPAYRFRRDDWFREQAVAINAECRRLGLLP